MARATLRGDKRLHHQLRRLRHQAPEIAAEAGQAWGEAVQADARSRVPDRTGRLKRGITVQVQKRSLSFSVGTHNGPFYGHLVENGTSDTPAQPFLLPAFTAHRGDIVRYVRAAVETRLP
ncbi:phage protein, HK97 gp10 family [Actinopolyspora alba]|uniref:Phage protein, HK97 gp10 family n=1 Tax=Actinopolyspora alba TaxID=673379 RepID=A0A1I2BFI6_9ACTN|nr:HK97-gp10 family putative phage morphogenesis protein [Actinopolyspora alba]SFE54648.1 phage protein, HK97 gp10 family [Actinopolyspora alba]